MEQTEEDLSSPSREMVPESSRDETASNEKSRDGKGGRKISGEAIGYDCAVGDDGGRGAGDGGG